MACVCVYSEAKDIGGKELHQEPSRLTLRGPGRTSHSGWPLGHKH